MPYTSQQLSEILWKLDLIFASDANKIYNKSALGIDYENRYVVNRLWLYRRIIMGWNQNDDGDITGIYNSILGEQFNDVITDALNYIKDMIHKVPSNVIINGYVYNGYVS